MTMWIARHLEITPSLAFVKYSFSVDFFVALLCTNEIGDEGQRIAEGSFVGVCTREEYSNKKIFALFD